MMAADSPWICEDGKQKESDGMFSRWIPSPVFIFYTFETTAQIWMCCQCMLLLLHFLSSQSDRAEPGDGYCQGPAPNGRNSTQKPQ